jgi:alkylhydroperoxidase family enzyme
MTLFIFTLLLGAANQRPDTSKPLGLTRDAEKELLELHKQAKPRLPMPPPDPNNPVGRVNNGAFRAYYLPDFPDTGLIRTVDPAMSLDSTFKVKLFWITSRANNCFYCLGHQEYKLLNSGLNDDDIAALDGDWHTATPKERAAFVFTKKLTHTPHLVTVADVEALKQHYSPLQVAEILITVAGYNATNRWTDGLNIPAEEAGERFRKEGVQVDLSSFRTPTSAKFKKQMSSVAPVRLAPRPPLESRDMVESLLKENRSAVLPLADADTVADLWTDKPVPNWVVLLATFPKSMKGRIAGLKASTEKGSLSPKLKGAIAWVAARNDRAWYALAVARDRLRKAGMSDNDIWKLDGDRNHLSEAEQAALMLTETLTVAPWKVTDQMVERCRRSFKDTEVAEIIHQTCNAAFFNRVTEVARLPFDK